MGEIDHIEVLRGSDALFGANGNPGATVNLVRKRPLDTFEIDTHSVLGSWHNYRQEIDVTGPLGFDGALRGRFDAAYSDRDYFYQGARSDHRSLFGVLEYDLTSQTLLTLGGSYQWNYGCLSRAAYPCSPMEAMPICPVGPPSPSTGSASTPRIVKGTFSSDKSLARTGNWRPT